ncbi:hypothetical protein [Parendozoicomonas haliclonae]|uniref:Uncharacterized protein n=1 Tax=Parendozoicomonas haliclonae TaxID=1960125 RepID=A0A1X7AL56_9GAMM|nr:hypothetical protein [Parendozoicomonas haliclonae]SMA47981.1 hypothetical protein EHSB41UT_02624 [Parendozoicomonas haliclonae]
MIEGDKEFLQNPRTRIPFHCIRKYARLVALGSCASVIICIQNTQAATLFFDDQTAASSYGFSAKATGFKGDALKYFTKVNGHTYTIGNVSSQGNDIPNSTNISLQNVNDDTHPTMGAFPQGSLGWSFDGSSTANPTYTFTVFAGGKYYYPDERSYSITITVDGKGLGTVNTNTSSDWHPTHFNKIPFNKNSKIDVVLKPL